VFIGNAKAVEVAGDQVNPHIPNKVRIVIVDPRTGNEKDIETTGLSDSDPMSETDPMS
jgi:hypothetical protein